jgi:glycosyltransferase involved in cell wall biosynthesis
MPINRLKSLWSQRFAQISRSKRRPVSALADPLRYAYRFESSYQKPRILILVDHVRATYFLSFHYVLERLHNQAELAFFVLDSGEIERWSQHKSPEAFVQQVIAEVQPTVVIFSRYGQPHGDRLPALFKANQIATVCHMDDDLLNIPLALGTDIQKRHGDQAVLRARNILLAESDLIYASTAFLGDHFTTQFPQQTIFQGIYAPYLNGLLTDEPSEPPSAMTLSASKPLTIGYMGSKGHQKDLAMVSPAIAQIMRQHPHLRFETFGTIDLPDELKPFRDRVCAYKTNTDYAGFLNQLQQLHWDIGLAPLEDTDFNRCKAPTKYIEYTTCGIATIASSGNVYSQFIPENQILIAQPNEWRDKIQRLITNPALRVALVSEGQRYCAQTFSLGVLETQIKKLLVLISLAA